MNLICIEAVEEVGVILPLGAEEACHLLGVLVEAVRHNFRLQAEPFVRAAEVEEGRLDNVPEVDHTTELLEEQNEAVGQCFRNPDLR